MVRAYSIFIILTIAFYTRMAHADDIRTIHFPEGVLAQKTEQGYRGAFPDILKEAAKRLGRPIELDALPWLRSQHNGRHMKGGAVAPLTRVPEREQDYIWVEKLWPLNLTFIVMADNKASYHRLSDLKGERIGVLRGSVADVLTRDMPHLKDNITLSSTGTSLSKLLQHRRIDGWLIWDIYGLETLRKQGLIPYVKTTFSHTVGPLYLATNPSVDMADVRLWRQTLRTMKEDGTIADIIQRYYGNKVAAAAMR